MTDHSDPPPRRFRLDLVIAALALALFIALALVVDMRHGWLHSVDQDVDQTLNRFVRRNRGSLWFWKDVSAVGGPTVFRVAALIGAILLWWRRRRSAALYVVVAVGGTMILSAAVKEIVGRSRPVLAHPVVMQLTSKSFPSGHALTSCVALGAAVVLALPYLNRAWSFAVTALAALLVALVGLSRLMLGVHFPTDVIGAWLLGGLWLAVVAYLFAPHRRRTLPPPKQRIGSSG